jgi:hypothetical protein
MALQDLVQQNKKKVLRRGPNGQLVEDTTEEVQSLAAKAGLASPPITPSGQGMIGANADQQKMAGTPAQKQAALSMSMSSADNLQDVMRTAQARTQMTGQEAQASEKSENLKALGGLGDRVHEFIGAQRAKLDAAAQTSAPGVAVEAAGTFQGKDVAALKPLLDQLRANPNDMNVMLEVNKALGYDHNKQLDPAEIDQLYESAVSSISRGTAGNIDDDLTAEDLLAQGNLGYSKEQLSELLGIPLDQVGALSVRQIRDTITKLSEEEFSRTEQLEQQAGSTELGVAERGLARTAARDMSATGVRASEADVTNLEQQISSADQVQFAGRSYSVEDLLKDETISSIVTEYMNSGPDSEIRKQIDQREPALKAFIEKNQALLGEASQALQSQAGEFRAIQSDNKRAATIDGLLSNDVAAKLVPQYGNLSASRLDPSQVPVLAVANSLSGDGKRQYAQNINSVIQQLPHTIEEMQGLTADEIAGLQLDKPNGKWSSYVNDYNRYKEITSIPDQDINRIAASVFDVGDADFQKDLTLRTVRYQLGFGGELGSVGFLDSNDDGRVDSGENIKAKLVRTEPSLRNTLAERETVKGRQRYTQPDPMPEPSSDSIRMDNLLKKDEKELQASLYQLLGSAAADGVLEAPEIIQHMQPQGFFTDDQLKSRQNELDYLSSHGALDRDGRGTAQSLISDARKLLSTRIVDTDEVRRLESQNLIADEGQHGKKYRERIYETRAAIADLKARSQGDHYDRAIIDNKVNALQQKVDDADRRRAQLVIQYGANNLVEDYQDPGVQRFLREMGYYDRKETSGNPKGSGNTTPDSNKKKKK